MSIKFIEEPLFSINFNQFVKDKEVENLSFYQEVQRIVSRPFELIQFIFIAVAKSAYTTLQYSWTSFKHIVLGYYGSLSKFRRPQDIYLVAFKVAFWVLAVSWCFITTTLRLLIDQIRPPSNAFLMEFTGGEINIKHLQTKELAIEVSNVPKEVSVDALMTIFNEINFSDQGQPGYMAPSSRKEDDVTYAIEDLRKNLSIFINNVKGRVPLLGTPPAYDTPRLMAFYQQIEDAIRFSIHKTNNDLKEFQRKYGIDPAQYQEAQLRQYKDLLETQARVALDMAIAGKHCGARYMGEALSTYFSLKYDTSEDGTLQDSLIELLAHKRKKIAQAQVQMHLGNNTHSLSQYMANLGQPLGLPGTSNVIEHLNQDFNTNHFLRLFFKDYTVNVIIDTVQAKIKNSQPFREKIIDWLKAQVGEWKKAANDIQGRLKMEQIQPIIDQKVESSLPSHDFQKFQDLISHLKEKKVVWPSDENWADFIDELLALDESKKWLQTQFSSAKPIELQNEKQKLKNSCSENSLDKDIALQLREAILYGKPLPLAAIGEKDIEKQKIKKIREILPIQSETLSRVLKGKVTLETAIKDHYNLTRQQEFLFALKIDNIATEGVSPEILEWLLVSQNILLPQEIG
jgi:hypothetical protein